MHQRTRLVIAYRDALAISRYFYSLRTASHFCRGYFDYSEVQFCPLLHIAGCGLAILININPDDIYPPTDLRDQTSERPYQNTMFLLLQCLSWRANSTYNSLYLSGSYLGTYLYLRFKAEAYVPTYQIPILCCTSIRSGHV